MCTAPSVPTNEYEPLTTWTGSSFSMTTCACSSRFCPSDVSNLWNMCWMDNFIQSTSAFKWNFWSTMLVTVKMSPFGRYEQFAMHYLHEIIWSNTVVVVLILNDLWFSHFGRVSSVECSGWCENNANSSEHDGSLHADLVNFRSITTNGKWWWIHRRCLFL